MFSRFCHETKNFTVRIGHFSDISTVYNTVSITVSASEELFVLLFIEPSKSKGRVFHQARKNILRQRSSQQELTLKPHKSIKIGEIDKMGKKKWQILAAAAMTVGANMIETEGVNQMDASSFLSRVK